jgi:DNA polymerase III delta subunit
MLTRDCNALSALKMGRKDLKEFGIWDNQINLYQKMENRLTKNQITEVTSILDDADKKVKGVLPGNSWLTAREAVRLLSA